MERQLGYWKRQLDGMAVLELPDRPDAAGAAEPPWRVGEAGVGRRVDGAVEGDEPAGRRDAVHGAAGGISGGVGAVQRSRRMWR